MARHRRIAIVLLAVLAIPTALSVGPAGTDTASADPAAPRDSGSNPAAPSASATDAAPAANVEPPLYTNKRPGAVHMMRASNGNYYAYDFTHGDGPLKINVWKSTNGGVRWAPPKKIAPPTRANGGWGVTKFWAPEVIEYDGRYYMFYAANRTQQSPSHRLGLAIADSPEGPFVDIGQPLFQGTRMEDWHVIDPNPFIDPWTGYHYLYFVRDGATHLAPHPDGSGRMAYQSRIFGIRLGKDWRTPKTDAKLLLKPSQQWEYADHRAGDGNWRLWNEAPSMVKVNNRFYLLYSANFFNSRDYAVGYASSNVPLGTFTKGSRNPIARSIGEYHKAGHTSVVKSPDKSEVFVSYSVLFDDDGDGDDSVTRFLSKAGLRDDGSMFINGPQKGWQVMPSGSTDWTGLGDAATLTASATASGHPVSRIVDGETGVYPRLARYEWRAANQRAGAWVQLEWDEPRQVSHLLVYDSAEVSRRIAKGHVVVNGNQRYDVSLPEHSPFGASPAVVEFPEPKRVTSVRFVVDSMLRSGDAPAALSEIRVLGPG